MRLGLMRLLHCKQQMFRFLCPDAIHPALDPWSCALWQLMAANDGSTKLHPPFPLSQACPVNQAVTPASSRAPLKLSHAAMHVSRTV